MKGTFMADYFTNFSFVLKLDAELKQYALDLAKKGSNYSTDDKIPDGFPVSLVDVLDDWSFETEENKDGIWLHSDCGGIDAVCLFIQHLLQKYDIQGHIAFEWSCDCNQPRTDAYGGGAAFITATEIESMTTAEWLRSKTS
jgi:hypothetical protein